MSHILFFLKILIRIDEVNVRQRRYRHNFHSFVLSDKEDILSESKIIIYQGLSDPLMIDIKTYVKDNKPKEKEGKSKT